MFLFKIDIRRLESVSPKIAITESSSLYKFEDTIQQSDTENAQHSQTVATQGSNMH